MPTDTRSAPDAEPTMGPDALDYDQYGAVETGDDLIVYDLDSEEAWVQSSVYVTLEASR
jgi:hypothetical protein